MAPTPPNDRVPRRARLVPAMNMTTKVVAADEDGRAEIDLGDDERDEQTNDRHREDETAQELAALLFITRKPEREKDDGRELGELGGLTGDAVKLEPAPGAIDLVPERRQKTERQPDEREGEPDIPGALPEMVIDQGRGDAGDEPDPEPHRVPAQEIINVVVTVAREGAGAEEDDDANRQQSQDSKKQDVGALPLHRAFLAVVSLVWLCSWFGLGCAASVRSAICAGR